MKEITGQQTAEWFKKYQENKKNEQDHESRMKTIFELEKFRASQEARRI